MGHDETQFPINRRTEVGDYQHQCDAFVVKGKEPHFFSENRQYARGWAWYMSLYSGYTG
jgi:hypothetical protein